jgi:hypothetical protein
LQALAEEPWKKSASLQASSHQDVAGKEARLFGQQHQERRLRDHKAGGLRDRKQSKGKNEVGKEKEKPLKRREGKAGRSRQSARRDSIPRHHGNHKKPARERLVALGVVVFQFSRF